MPGGPNGQKRPADVVGCAITVAKIATGEIKKYLTGGKVRAQKLRAEERSRIANKAAEVRWS